MDLASLIFSGKLIPEAPSLLMLLFPEFPSICRRLCSAAEPSTRRDVLRQKAVCPGGSAFCFSSVLPSKSLTGLSQPPAPTSVHLLSLGLTFPPTSTPRTLSCSLRWAVLESQESSESLGTTWCVEACVAVSGTRGRGFVVSLNVCVFTF